MTKPAEGDETRPLTWAEVGEAFKRTGTAHADLEAATNALTEAMRSAQADET